MTLENKLKEIKDRCDLATEGPWNPIDEQRDTEVFHHVVKRMRNDNGWSYVAGETGLKDTLFIAHARTDVPMLLEMVELQQATLDCVLVALAEHDNDLANDMAKNYKRNMTETVEDYK